MLKKTGWLTTCLCTLLLLTACNPKAETGKNETQSNDVSNLNWQVENFVFTNQDNQSVGLKDLKGNVWIAQFAFTRCPNVCPPMTANLVKIQQKIKEAKKQVQFVSFSVDPAHDTPAVLKKFAKQHGVDFTNWHWLTGYKQSYIQAMAKNSFKGIVESPQAESPDAPVLINHPTLFYLVDKQGKVAAYYNGLKPDIAQIIKDVERLQ